MKRHASMNRIYRLVWSHVHKVWIPVAEIARGRSKGSSRKLFAAALSLTAAVGHTEPIGGQIVSGSLSSPIEQSGGTTTINQASQNLSLNWQSFNIAPTETVNFVQPNTSAIAVNRIADTNGTQILGHLNANGQVYLINPNGIVFGQGAQVNVGGLVASTLDVNDASLDSNTRTFSGSGTGSVINKGKITANGGSVALIGNSVGNQGTITAQLGTVALGAGNAVTLTFSGNSLVHMQVDQSMLNSLAENGGLIRADGGQVIMTAGARDTLLASVVNNTGVIEARTVEQHEGVITLLGGMTAGTVNVGGSLDASAPNGGHGGFIETSASNVVIQSGATVTAGDDGTWLIDPTNITIDSTAASTIAGALNTGTNVTQTTSSGGVDTGDITVASAITWTGAGTLILNADHDININADIIGSNGGLTLNAANTISATAAVNVKNFNLDNGNWNQLATSLPGFNAYNFRINGGSFLRALSGSGTSVNPYLLTDVYGLQGMDTYLSSSFALSNNIDASGTLNWNGGGGFDPIFNIGLSSYTPFTGMFNGQNHTIDGLNIVRSYADFQGLFGYTKGAAISNVALTNANVVGAGYVGALIGWGVDTNLSNISTSGTVSSPGASTSSGTGGVAGVLERGYGVTTNITADNVHSTANVTGAYSVGGVFGAFGGGVANNITAAGNVSGGQDNVGGLLGTLMLATLTNGHAIGAVSANNKAGGLIGFSQNSTISDAYATGSVSASHWVGGLVGEFESSTLTNSHVSGNVSGVNYVGGLVGKVVSGSLGNVWASGAVTSSYIAGGLVGENVGGSISNAHATGTVNGSVSVGGLVGSNSAAIDHVYATGVVNCASQYCGGLVGSNSGNVISAYATGNVNGGTFAGGLVGINSSVITKSYATGNVTGNDRSGGLVGRNYLGSIDTSFATGGVTGLYAGGLVGENGSLISNSYATGNVSAIGASNASVGGLVGFNDATPGNPSVISNSYATGAVSENPSYAGMLGGLLGFNGDSTIQDSYWNTETTGRSVAVGATYESVTGGSIVVGTISNVAGLTTAQMHAQSNFTTLDFTNKWFMYEGYTAPLLRDFMTHLTVTLNDASKTYDATNYSGGNGFTAGTYNPSLLLGALSYSGSAQGAKNAGSYTIGGSGLYSSQLGYIIDNYVDGALIINKASLTLNAAADSKTYDGTTNSSGVVSSSGLQTGDTLTSVSQVYANKHAGSRTLNVAAYTVNDGNSGNNYNVVTNTASGSISQVDLAVTGLTAIGKVYDTNTAVTLGGVAAISALTGDTVILGGTAGGVFADKNVGTGKAVTVTGNSLTGTDSGNYNLVQQSGLTANITKADLAVSGLTASNKVYDANTAATLGGAAAITALTGDSVTLGGTAGGVFADKNVGTGKAVTVTGNSLTGTDSGNYNLVQQSGLTANITKANLLVTGLTASNKVYDANTAATLGGAAAITALGGDSVTLGGTAGGVFADKNVGTGKAVTVTGNSLTGTDSGNYNLVQQTGLSADISKADLAVSGLTASNKVYDANTAATLGGAAAITALTGDVVTLGGTAGGVFADKNVGTGKAVTVTGNSLTGSDSGNYNLLQQTGLSADISKADLAVSGLTATGKVYDANTAATLGGAAAIAALGSDSVTLGGTAGGVFADKNVGTGKAVTVTGNSLTGTDSGNYNLVQQTGLSADISKADLAVTGLTAIGKVYDTNTTATLGGTAAISALTGDTVILGGTASGAFADKTAANGKAVTVTGNSLTGIDSGNYNLVQQTGLTANITKADLAVSGLTAAGKVYDANTSATLGGVAAITALGGDSVTLGGTAGGAFADKNVGTGKAVTVTGNSLTGTDSGNYNLVQQSGLTANITKADLAVSGLIASNKVYDANTAATLGGVAAITALAGDVVTLGGTAGGVFADKNVGTGKAVTVTGNSLTGIDSGNYNLVQQSGLTANISKADLAVSGLTATGKVYDANTAATLGGAAAITALTGDVVTLGGTAGGVFADKNVGTGKAVTVTGNSLTGTDSGNYNLVQQSGLTANITKADLAVSGLTATGKVYDANTAATLGGAAAITALTGDVVTLGGTAGGAFADKNVGTGKAVTVTGNSLTGTDSGNYNLMQQTGLTANITKADLAVSGLTASNKVYDANTAATLGGAAAITALTGDVVTLGGTAGGVFADKNVGTGKAVTVTGNSLTGIDSGNYNLVQQTGLTANITKANLAVTGVTANNKVFDATRAATLGGTAAVVALGNDVVIAGGGSGLFNDANAGTGKAVAVSGFTLSGVDSGNYNVLQPTGLMADITAAPSTSVPEPTPVTTPPPSQESRRPLEPVRNVTSQLTANLISPSGNNQPGTPDQPSFTKNTQELGTDQPSANKDTQGFDQGAGGEKPSSVKSGQKPIVETTMKIGDNGPTIEVVNGGIRFLGNNQPNEKDSDEI